MAHRVYIDGHAGTTGLRIREWLAGREDLSLATLDEAQRKDPDARREQIAAADVAVLCLPDDAAREAADWAQASGTRVLDTSTAHRVAESWVYGLPELAPDQREAIAGAAQVSNPGCYPTGFILATRPLVDSGLLAIETPLVLHALSGYTGGGRPMIEKWEDPATGLDALSFEAPYALERVHKHIPEMIRYSGLQTEPQFLPAVGPFRCGMRVQIPLHADWLSAGAQAKQIVETLETRYCDEPFVHVHPLAEAEASNEHTFDPRACNDTNRIELRVVAHPSGHVLLVAVLDNLGKGASGVAIQSLNLMLGCPEVTGLRG